MDVSPFPSAPLHASTSSSSLNPSILLIILILTIVLVMSISIHFFLLYLDRRRCAGHENEIGVPASTRGRRVTPEQDSLVHSLPVFKFSSVSASDGSCKDCAVCLARFEPHDQLRLLPACCHAFHALCIDTWLASNRTCPLCRTSVEFSDSIKAGKLESGSFRIEIGNLSLRESNSQSRRRSYSLGSFDYIVDDQVEVTASGVILSSSGSSKDSVISIPVAESATIDTVAEAAGSRGWLKEYVDRLASSASSSMSSRSISMRFSGLFSRNSSRRVNGITTEDGGTAGEEDDFSQFLRWLAGV